MSQSTLGVVIGRFQILEVRDETQSYLDKVYHAHANTLLLLCTSPVPGHRLQPLSYVMRKMAIQPYYPNMTIECLHDMADPTQWVKSVDAAIQKCYPFMSVTIYASGFWKSLYKDHGGKHEITNPGNLALSNRIVSPAYTSKIIDSSDFRSGVIFGTDQSYPKIISTVDGAVVDKNGTVLLGKKYHENQWRFMGGFTDPKSKTDEEDLSREAKEELNLTIGVDDWKYIGRYNIDDWRYRDSGDQIRTGFFVTGKYTGEPKAGDDLEYVKWFPMTQNPSSVPLVTQHKILWEALIKYLLENSIFKS